MKHKGQEALDNLFDEAATEYDVDDGELILLDFTNCDRYLDMREPLQQTIDCQLDKEMLNRLIKHLNNDTKRYWNDVIVLLQKQKKMWEVE